MMVLRSRLLNRVKDNAWVFPSDSSKSGHLLDLKRGWKKLRKRAKLTDVRIHDLRRTLGSWQAASGTSLQIIGKSLGHGSIQSTQVYAYLRMAPVRESVQNATAAMLTAAKITPDKLLPEAKDEESA
jgi:integrase